MVSKIIPTSSLSEKANIAITVLFQISVASDILNEPKLYLDTHIPSIVRSVDLEQVRLIIGLYTPSAPKYYSVHSVVKFY